MSDSNKHKPSISRRTVVRGAAWTVPAVATVSMAPAYAASLVGSASATGGNGTTGSGTGAGGASNVTTVGLVGSVVNIPCGRTVTFTVTGAGGGVADFLDLQGGSGSRISGTFVTSCACGGSTPVTLIAGGGGGYMGANYIGLGATGGKGYGDGGNAGATNASPALSGSGISRRQGGSGGAGSAILIGGVPLVVAGGGGGGGHVIDDFSQNSPTVTWNTTGIVGGHGGNADGGNGTATVNTWTYSPGSSYTITDPGASGASGATGGAGSVAGSTTAANQRVAGVFLAGATGGNFVAATGGIGANGTSGGLAAPSPGGAFPARFINMGGAGGGGGYAGGGSTGLSLANNMVGTTDGMIGAVGGAGAGSNYVAATAVGCASAPTITSTTVPLNGGKQNGSTTNFGKGGTITLNWA